MSTQTITTEHGTYFVKTAPGYAVIFKLRDSDSGLSRIGVVEKVHDEWVPQSQRDGQFTTHPAEKTRKAAINRIITGYEAEARREAAHAEAKRELRAQAPKLGEAISQVLADEARQSIATGILAGIAEFEAEEAERAAIREEMDSWEDTPATVTLTDDREYEKSFGGSTREVLVFAGREFSVGYIAEGDEGRQVFQGPMVPGPWAWANACPIVLSAHRDPNPRPRVVVADGDHVLVGGTRYVVRDARQKTGRWANDHWLELENA